MRKPSLSLNLSLREMGVPQAKIFFFKNALLVLHQSCICEPYYLQLAGTCCCLHLDTCAPNSLSRSCNVVSKGIIIYQQKFQPILLLRVLLHKGSVFKIKHIQVIRPGILQSDEQTVSPRVN